MNRVSPILAVTGVLLLAGYAKPPAQPVEDFGDGQNVARFKLRSLTAPAGLRSPFTFR